MPKLRRLDFLAIISQNDPYLKTSITIETVIIRQRTFIVLLNKPTAKQVFDEKDHQCSKTVQTKGTATFGLRILQPFFST